MRLYCAKVIFVVLLEFLENCLGMQTELNFELPWEDLRSSR